MPKILFVLPTLEFSGAAKQARLLAAGLPRDRFEVAVGALGEDGPAAGAFRAAGVPVYPLGRRRFLPLTLAWRLRRLVRDFRPDVIHTWGPAPLRAVALVVRPGDGRLLASAPLPAWEKSGPGRLDRWLLRRADRLLARGPAEAARWHHLGLPRERVVVVPPGVEHQGSGRRSQEMQAVLPDACSLILCAGPLEPHKGFLDAIWAFDILQFLYEGLRLVVAGAGPDGPRLRRFAQVTGASRRVHFAGRLPDLPAILDRAAVVWVPSRAEAGVNIALEAMARGRPVVASRLPGLAEIIRDGETGFLARPGDKVELARLTRQLLDSAPLRQRFGEVARRRAAERFSLSALLQSMSDLYAMGKAA